MAKQRNIEQSSGQHLLEHLFQSQDTKAAPEAAFFHHILLFACP